MNPVIAKLLGPLFLFFGILLVACNTTATSSPTSTSGLSFTETSTLTSTRTVAIFPTLTPELTQTIQTLITPTTLIADCTQGWTQFIVGAKAQVAGDKNDLPNRVRSEASKNSGMIAQIYPGDVVKLLEGPVCADGLVYWKVESDKIPGGMGWTAEGDGREYWLQPYMVRMYAWNIDFYVPEDWEVKIEAEKVPAGHDIYWENCKWPAHTLIQFTNYRASSSWSPSLYVYLTSDMPGWLPGCGGAPLLRIQEKTLKNGNRLVFGSMNAQPIFNNGLIYFYSGTTRDGLHTVVALLPVNFPYLAYSNQNNQLPQGGIPFDLETSDWDPYYKLVGEQLDNAQESDFSPDLSQLDRLVESIEVVSR